MNPQLATIVYLVLILAIFYLDHDKAAHTSKALWVPVAWLMINGSRPVSMWFQSGPTVDNGYVDGSPLDAGVYGVLVLAALLILAARWSRIQEIVTNNSALLVYVAYCLASTLWSDYTFVSFKRWIKSIGDIAMILIVLTERNQHAAVRRFLCRVGYVVIPLSILCIKYYPNIGRSYNQWTWLPQYCGVTTFKNLLGMITLVCAVGVLWSFVCTWRDRPPHRWRHLFAQSIVLAMAVWIFHIADSMTSLACCVLTGSVMVLANQSWAARKKALVHAMLAGIVAISVIALFFDSSGGMVQSLGRNSTLTGRTDIWRIVIELSKPNQLLGAGFETFWMGERLETMFRFEKGIQEAHNGYLEVYANLGWVGVLLIAAVIVAGYRNVFRTYAQDRALGSLKIAFFATGLIYSLTEAGFRMMSPVWLGFLLAIIYVPSMKRRHDSAPSIQDRVAAQTESHALALSVT